MLAPVHCLVKEESGPVLAPVHCLVKEESGPELAPVQRKKVDLC